MKAHESKEAGFERFSRKKFFIMLEKGKIHIYSVKFQKLFIIPKKIMIRGITLLNVQNDMGDVPTMFC